MKRGVILSLVTILIVDVPIYIYFSQIIALLLSCGSIFFALIGEYMGLAQMGAVICEDKRLEHCFNNVKSSAGFGSNIKLYIVPNRGDFNAYSLGVHSIVITEPISKLDTFTIEAVIAHEMGHAKNYDSLFKAVASIHFLGIVTIITLCQLSTIAVIIISASILIIAGICHTSFFTYFTTKKIIMLCKTIFSLFNSFIYIIYRLIMSFLERGSEHRADAFAARLGYKTPLENFLVRFVNDNKGNSSFYEKIYSSHPSCESRIRYIQKLK